MVRVQSRTIDMEVETPFKIQHQYRMSRKEREEAGEEKGNSGRSDSSDADESFCGFCLGHNPEVLHVNPPRY